MLWELAITPLDDGRASSSPFAGGDQLIGAVAEERLHGLWVLLFARVDVLLD